jgi:hypothetical protein
VARDNQRARRGVKLLGALEDLHLAARSSQQRRREKTRGRATDDGDLLAGFTSASLFDLVLQCALPSPQCPIP